MKVIELYRYLDSHIPESLSCEWDNDGLMCCPDENAEVKRVLVTLDVTDDAIKKAREIDADVILSHHPLIFKGVKALNGSGVVSSRAIELIKSGISVMSFHTRLDAVDGGVNDVLALTLGIEDAEPFGDEGIGRIGDLDAPMSLDEFAYLVKERLNAPVVTYSGNGSDVFRVAVLGGSGADDLPAAIAAGADTYLSGTLSYHDMADAPDGSINLVEAGHFHTEDPVCDMLSELVWSADDSIETVYFNSYRAKTM